MSHLTWMLETVLRSSGKLGCSLNLRVITQGLQNNIFKCSISSALYKMQIRQLWDFILLQIEWQQFLVRSWEREFLKHCRWEYKLMKLLWKAMRGFLKNLKKKEEPYDWYIIPRHTSQKKPLYSVNAISVHSDSLMFCSLYPINVNSQVSIGKDFNLILGRTGKYHTELS